MKKRIILILLALSLIVGSLVACTSDTIDGPDSNLQDDSSKVDSPSSDSPSTDPTTEDKYNLPLCEPGSETLSILTYQNWHASSFYDSEDGLEIENKIEEITGVKIDWECVPSGDYNTVAQTRLASGTDLPDIIRIPNGPVGLAKYSDQGILIKLNDYINETDTPNLVNLLGERPIYKAYLTSPDGNIYGLPHAEYDINNYVPMWNIIRKDWLDKLNLDMPKTIDEYHDALVAFRDKDPNGNGKNDEIPQGYQNESMFGLYTFKIAFGFNNTDIWSIDDEGKVNFDLMDPKFLDCLTTLNQWSQEGLLSPTADGSDSDTLISQDRLGAQTISSADNLISKDDLVRDVNPDGKHVFIPLLTNPKYPDNKATLNKRQDFHDYYSVTIDCKNPKLATQWLDWVYASEDSMILRYWGIEDKTYKDENGEKVFLDYVVNGDFGAIDIMRSIGGWPNFVGNEYGKPFMAMYKGTYVEDAYNEFKDIMTDRVPTTIGTLEESEIYSSKWPDIHTYVRENVVNFIMGNRPLTEWDSYVNTLKEMGIDEVISVKQAWADRADELINH